MIYQHTPIVRMSWAVEAAIRVERQLMKIKDLEKEVTGSYEMSAIAFCDPETWKCRCSLNVYPTGVSSDAKATPYEMAMKVRNILDKAEPLKKGKDKDGKEEDWHRHDDKNEKEEWQRISWTMKYDVAVEGYSDSVELRVWVQESFKREKK